MVLIFRIGRIYERMESNIKMLSITIKEYRDIFNIHIEHDNENFKEVREKLNKLEVAIAHITK
jgi:hypothetical protein